MISAREKIYPRDLDPLAQAGQAHGVVGGGEELLSIGDLHFVQQISDLLDRQTLRDRNNEKNTLAGNQPVQDFPRRDAALEPI